MRSVWRYVLIIPSNLWTNPVLALQASRGGPEVRAGPILEDPRVESGRSQVGDVGQGAFTLGDSLVRKGEGKEGEEKATLFPEGEGRGDGSSWKENR